MSRQHRVEVYMRRANGVTTYTPACDCGWIGREVDTRRDAEEDADEHVREES